MENIVIVEYKSDTFLPENINNKFTKAISDVIDVRNETDKINCVISRLRGDVISWLADNGIMVTDTLKDNK